MRENRYCCPGKWVVLIAYRQSETDLVGKTIALQAGSIAGVRILVVEDNELNMEIAEYMFTERGAVVECQPMLLMMMSQGAGRQE